MMLLSILGLDSFIQTLTWKLAKRFTFLILIFMTSYPRIMLNIRMWVARWTKSMNLFKKQLIVIPVCKASHWFTILVINPGLITVNICSSIFGAVKMHYKNYFFPSLQRSPVTGKGGMH